MNSTEKKFLLRSILTSVAFSYATAAVLAGAVGGPRTFELKFEDRGGGFIESKLLEIEFEGGKEASFVLTSNVCGSVVVHLPDKTTVLAGKMERLKSDPQRCGIRGNWTPANTSKHLFNVMNDSREPSTYILATN